VKLFAKLFATLGIVITIAMVAAVTLGFYIGQLTYQQWLAVDFPEREPTINRAQTALNSGGREELTEWLRQNQEPAPGLKLFITDSDYQDLLGREIPNLGQFFLNPWDYRGGSGIYRGSGAGGGGAGAGDGQDFGGRRGGGPRGLGDGRYSPYAAVRNRFSPQYVEVLVGQNENEPYFTLFRQTPITVLEMMNLPATRFGVVTLAIIMAAATSLLLAKSLSSPIVRLQRATRGLAAGMLDTRVGAPFNRRKDEVGTLARDFDTMAEQIQALITDKEVLLRDVSHELRSPLARIQVALALAERKATPETRIDLERIEQEAEKLEQLVGQILTLARLRSSPLDTHANVDVAEIVAEVVADARFEHPDVALSFEPSQVPPIDGNSSELGSAIENVLRNALLHAGDKAEVTVLLKRQPGGVLLTISDNGPGVPENALPHLFEPFYRADPSRDHKQSGYGLGLAIASSIIERHGGTVAARNRPGGGLEVSFRLPARNSALN